MRTTNDFIVPPTVSLISTRKLIKVWRLFSSRNYFLLLHLSYMISAKIFYVGIKYLRIWELVDAMVLDAETSDNIL